MSNLCKSVLTTFEKTVDYFTPLVAAVLQPKERRLSVQGARLAAFTKARRSFHHNVLNYMIFHSDVYSQYGASNSPDSGKKSPVVCGRKEIGPSGPAINLQHTHTHTQSERRKNVITLKQKGLYWLGAADSLNLCPADRLILLANWTIIEKRSL